MTVGLITIGIGSSIIFLILRFVIYGMRPRERFDHYIVAGFVCFSLVLIFVGSFSIMNQYTSADDTINYVSQNGADNLTVTSIE